MRFFQLSLFFDIFRPKPIFSESIQEVKRAPVQHNVQPPHKSRRSSKKSDPFLKPLWDSLIDEYFPDRHELKEYRLVWSNRRQKRTLAVCNIHLNKVTVAQELNSPWGMPYLSALLYHELCHAVLGRSIYRNNGRRAWHGPEFKSLEQRHPGIPALNRWIKEGGWGKAVRSSRASQTWKRRKAGV